MFTRNVKPVALVGIKIFLWGLRSAITYACGETVQLICCRCMGTPSFRTPKETLQMLTGRTDKLQIQPADAR